MRTVIDGAGHDATVAAAAWLKGQKLWMANLYLIGEPSDPRAIWLTDYESDLLWRPWGIFQHAVIQRGELGSKIGLEVASLEITWAPKNATFTSSVQTTSPLHLAQIGYYDNWPVRIWRALMPTPGDVETFGAYELFGGRIASTKFGRGSITWTANSLLDCINQQVPANVIEYTNTLASFTAATPPAGFAHIPRFVITDGSGPLVLLATCTYPDAGHVFDDGLMTGGYLVFDDGGATTLGRIWRTIAKSDHYDDGHGGNFNRFTLYAPLPWAPTTGADSFYVSAPCPISAGDQALLSDTLDPTNLVMNGDFEYGPNTSPALGWTHFRDGANWGYGAPYTGTRSYGVLPGSGGTYGPAIQHDTVLQVTPGDVYRIEAAMLCTDAATAAAVLLQFYQADHTYISQGSIGTSATSFDLQSADITVPAGAKFMQVVLANADNNHACYYDAVTVNKRIRVRGGVGGFAGFPYVPAPETAV